MFIEAFFALILGICVVWLFVHLQNEEEDDSTKNADLENILYKVLEKQARNSSAASIAPMAALAKSATAPSPIAPLTAKPIIQPLGIQTPLAPVAKPVVTPLSPVPVAPVAPVTPVAAVTSNLDPAEFAKLKSENEDKKLKLEVLEKSLAEAKKASATPVDTSEFEKKIKDLESRLGEYEIIEDDIANLSLYKEENARLKNELQKVKSPGASDEAELPMEAAAEEKAIKKAIDKEAVESENSPDVAPENIIDTAKLLDQAADLSAQPVPEGVVPANDGKDSGEKLIDEFENFMKGAGR